MDAERNVGETDRQVRYGLGAVAAFAGVAVGTTTAYALVGAVLALLGVWWVGTAFASYCPVNDALGVDTCGGS